jgi:di/tricarboxylate transporter
MSLTTDIAAFLVMFVLALILFAREWTPPDVTALGLMLGLILLGLLEPAAAFAGFGSDTVMMILGLLILTETLVHTGLVDAVGRWLLHLIGNSTARLQSMILVAPAVMSAFMSNTASTAFFLPIVLGLSRRSHISPSKLLMPLAFAAILAGSVTLIGTSTNLVVNGLMQQYGLEPMTIFELTPVGLPITIAGLIYMAVIGRRLIPDHTAPGDHETATEKELYFTEITVPAGSTLVGKTIDATGLIQHYKLGMLTLQRGNQSLKPLADMTLEANDTLLVEGSREAVLSLGNVPGIEISGGIQQLDEYARNGEARVAEVVVMPGSPLVGRTLKGIGLRDHYQIQVLAVNHAGDVRHARMGRMKFDVGDVLLIKIPQKNLYLLENERTLRTIDIIEMRVINPRKALLSSGIFVGALALAISGVLTIAVAVLLGALLVFLTRCITPDIAYRNIEWKTLILIGSMLAFGQAMQETGTADYLADLIIRLPGTGSPVWLLTIFFFLAMVLTQPMSNQAAAAVLIPIAIQTAVLLDYNPRPFAIMIALAASASFITPLEPSCVLVYSAGRYRFMDFIRVGGLLTLVVYAVAILLVPLIWSLTPG